MEAFRPYESPELREIIGPTLRPGGFTLTGRAVELCNLPAGATVLDIGCGLGATVHWLETHYGFKVLGLDASTRLLSEGRSAHAKASVMAGLADRLPLPGKSLDGIFCECVLSLLDQPEQALEEFGRVLKPGGRLVITDLYARRSEAPSTMESLPLNSCLSGARPREEISGLVEKADFNLVLWEDHSRLLKELAAKIVFECGSMKDFWGLFAPGCASSKIECALGRARPGYYLMIAVRR